MRLKFKDFFIEINTPVTYTDLQSQIFSHFHSSLAATAVNTPEGRYVVTSASEYEKIPIDSISELEAFAEMPSPREVSMVPLRQLDSIDTCTSHDKTDTDESKHSEIILSMTASSTSFTQKNQLSNARSGKEYKDAKTCTHDKKSDFSAQYDQSFSIKYEDMKKFISKIVLSNPNKPKTNSYSHQGFSCYTCKSKPIVGIRYECRTCQVNFCEDCEESSLHEHDRLVHKGQASLSPDSSTHKEQLLNKISEMGFEDLRKVKAVAERHKYDLNKTISELLFN